jgi:hypothetical protein
LEDDSPPDNTPPPVTEERPVAKTTPAVPAPQFSQPSTPSEPAKPKGIPKTVKLTDLLKTDQKAAEKENVAEKIMNEPFTEQQLREAWNQYAEQRRKYQAEFQMLSQPYTLNDKQIVVNLLSSVHETMLNNIKVELAGFLREKLRNSYIQVTGQLTESDDKKVIYTNRDKFEYLADKNPILKELKDRLGLDTDF